MNQKSTSDLPPLPEDTVEGQYAEESEEQDQRVKMQIMMRKMKDFLLTQSEKKGKGREQVFFTPGAIPSEPTLPRHVRPEYSPILPIPGPRTKFTPETEPKPQNIQRQDFVPKPDSQSTLQQQAPRQEITVVKVKAKDYNLNFDGEKVEKFIKKVERIAQIGGEKDEELAKDMEFWKTELKVSDEIEAMSHYEEGNLTQLKKDLI
ncbi:hypothetical protein O181_002465 [Austropuccinia psidii MF-1]|uniref:Uncharacterized protein n=1 Tax=Austropuccinia psidii MF-1 TaxID=1389203 RepID=A0A9Q3BD33_9BASI|nr:hypothetical protein [Austropuccinia psidii MF-1]